MSVVRNSRLVGMGFYQNQIVPHLVNVAMRNRQLAPYRERVIAQAQGRVLEIGVGSGVNLPFYTNRATEILGLEPYPKLLKMASKKAAGIPSKLIEGSAESIPLEDASVDTVVTTWTLCTIPDVDAALAEMHRLLKQDGRLLFVEHGLSSDEKIRKWQNRLTPAWRRIAGGCHLDGRLPPLSRLQDSGFHEWRPAICPVRSR